MTLSIVSGLKRETPRLIAGLHPRRRRGSDVILVRALDREDVVAGEREQPLLGRDQLLTTFTLFATRPIEEANRRPGRAGEVHVLVIGRPRSPQPVRAVDRAAPKPLLVEGDRRLDSRPRLANGLSPTGGPATEIGPDIVVAEAREVVVPI
jgi:hypothetical protein